MILVKLKLENWKRK